MKSNLTPSQSQRLIELGVDPSKASSSTKVYEQLTENVRWESQLPIFSLSDILSLLPKEIEEDIAVFYLDISSESPEWWYVGYENRTGELNLSFFNASELIDALYELLVWVLENYPDKIKRL